jgi:iron(III) transport system substrate-binding protein
MWFIRCLAAVLMLVSGCAPAALTPTATPVAAPGQGEVPKPATTSAPVAPTQATPSTGDASWDELTRQAKQEGELVVFLGRAGTRELRDAFPVFEQKFGIKVTQVAGSGDENADKVLAERQTGIYTGDLWMGGLTTINTRLLPAKVFDPLEPQLILPEVKDKSAWFKDSFSWGDPDKKYTFLFSASPAPLFSINTNLAKPGDISSLWDLLDPKWKSKIVSRDPTSAGTGGNTAYFYFHPQLGQDFLKRLYTEQDVTVMSDARQAAESLALGKFAIYLLGSGTDVLELHDQGLPVVDQYGPFKEGARIASGGTGSISIFNHAAHPNAARLFINWWLSKEGQVTAQKANPQAQSLRVDIPNDDVSPDTRRQPGVDYSFIDAEAEVVSNQADMLAYMKQVLGR